MHDADKNFVAGCIAARGGFSRAGYRRKNIRLTLELARKPWLALLLKSITGKGTVYTNVRVKPMKCPSSCNERHMHPHFSEVCQWHVSGYELIELMEELEDCLPTEIIDLYENYTEELAS